MTSAASAMGYARTAHVTHRTTTGPSAGTLVLVHGLGGDSTQFDRFLPHLAGLRFDLLLPDMRGHGGTTLIGEPGDFTFGQLSADLLTLIARYAVQPPLVGVGISMGAGILAATAIRSPATFAGLVFIRPAWEDRPDPVNLRAFRVIADLLATRDVTDAAAELARSPVYQAVRAESEYVADSLMEQITAPHATERRLRLACLPMSTPFASLADLRRIPVPVAVVGTERDPLHPLSIARGWADSCGTTPHIVAPKSAHNDRYVLGSADIITTLALRVADPTPTRAGHQPHRRRTTS